jgi:hypothetical protein
VEIEKIAYEETESDPEVPRISIKETLLERKGLNMPKLIWIRGRSRLGKMAEEQQNKKHKIREVKYGSRENSVKKRKRSNCQPTHQKIREKKVVSKGIK